MNEQIIWKPVNHPDILPGYLVSPHGYIKAEGMKDKDAITSPSYRSTNGYDFMLLNNKDGKVQLFPIDDIIAMAYIPIPESLKDKPIKVSHINGDTRDISLDNLQWVEDIEEWRVCTYPGVKPDTYEVSSWGRVRNKKTKMIVNGHIGYGRNKYIMMCLQQIPIQKFNKIDRQHTFVKHRLIAWEFLCHKNDITIVNHINGCKSHDMVKNLEWVTVSVNNSHAALTGLNKPLLGESGGSKISENVAKSICEKLVLYNGSIAKTLNDINLENVTYGIICGIKYGTCWAHISKKYFDIYLLTHHGVDISRKRLQDIKSGKCYKHITNKYLKG